jgi:hypothetical protein
MSSFGGDLYDALRERGRGWMLARQLGFAELQRFKQADREEALRLLRSSLDYPAIQSMKTASPEEFAELWSQRQLLLEQQYQGARGIGGVPWWALFLMLGGKP